LNGGDSRFTEPIELPNGVKLASLREAIGASRQYRPRIRMQHAGRPDGGGTDN